MRRISLPLRDRLRIAGEEARSKGPVRMTEKPTTPEADLYEAEEIAAERLIEQGEVAPGDSCDELDRFSDAALADRLVTAWAERLDGPDFPGLVDAFARLAR
jgi:hypothetical protein